MGGIGVGATRKSAIAVGTCFLLLSLAGTASSAAPAATSVEDLGLARTLGVPHLPSGIGVQLAAHFPEENALESGHGRVFATTLTVSDGATSASRSLGLEPRGVRVQAPAACTDGTYLNNGIAWTETAVKWRLNAATLPPRTDTKRALAALKQAHNVWEQPLTGCDGAVAPGIDFSFGGMSDATVGYDGINTIDFGPLEEEALAMSYTYFLGTEIVEVDLRLNESYLWTARSGVTNRYHIGNVVAHEVGHQIGLGDLAEPHGSLTMFGLLKQGETKNLTLGRGDLQGAHAVLP